MKMVMSDFDLFLTYDQEKELLWISTEYGSGAKYTVINPEQLASAMQKYVENYCMEAGYED